MQPERTASRIRAVLRTAALPTNAVAEAIGVTRDRARIVLTEMADEGAVEKCGKVRSGRVGMPQNIWKLVALVACAALAGCVPQPPDHGIRLTCRGPSGVHVIDAYRHGLDGGTYIFRNKGWSREWYYTALPGERCEATPLPAGVLQ